MIPEVTDISSFFRLPSSIGESVLRGPARAANQLLKQWCDAEMFEAAEAAADGELSDINEDDETDDADQAIVEVLKLAGSYLGGYYAAPAIGARLRTDGQVAFESSAPEKMIRYATPKEVDEWRQQLRRSAVEVLQTVSGLYINATAIRN